MVSLYRARKNGPFRCSRSNRPRRQEAELHPASRFVISYRQQWKKSFVARNFTWSNRNNPGKLSNNLRETRLEQKGGKHRCAGFARHLHVYGFFCDLLRHVRASTESDRQRTRNAITRGPFGSARSN